MQHNELISVCASSRKDASGFGLDIYFYYEFIFSFEDIELVVVKLQM